MREAARGRTGAQQPAIRTDADESYDSDSIRRTREQAKGRRLAPFVGGVAKRLARILVPPTALFLVATAIVVVSQSPDFYNPVLAIVVSRIGMKVATVGSLILFFVRLRAEGKRPDAVNTDAGQNRSDAAEVPQFLVDAVVIPRAGEGIRRLAHGVGATFSIAWALYVLSYGDGSKWLFLKLLSNHIDVEYHWKGLSASQTREGWIFFWMSIPAVYLAMWGFVRAVVWTRAGFVQQHTSASRFAGTGVRRLAFLASLVVVYLAFAIVFSDSDSEHWADFGIGLAILAAAAWCLIRGIAWVLDGFARDRRGRAK